jgi:hypothetical protein
MLYKMVKRYAANAVEAWNVYSRSLGSVLWQSREKHLSVLLVRRMIILYKERELERAE